MEELDEVFPDVIKTYYVSERGFGVIYEPPKPNLKLTFDSKTGDLKQAEVLK